MFQNIPERWGRCVCVCDEKIKIQIIKSKILDTVDAPSTSHPFVGEMSMKPKSIKASLSPTL